MIYTQHKLIEHKNRVITLLAAVVIWSLLGAAYASIKLYEARKQIATYGEFMQTFDCYDLDGDNLHDLTGEFMD